MRECFTYKREWFEQLLGLPRAVRQEVSEAIAAYGITGEPPELKAKAKAAFERIRADMDKDGGQRSQQMAGLAQRRWKNGESEAVKNGDEKFYHATRICDTHNAQKASRARIEVRDYLTLQQDNIESVCKGGVGERNDADGAATGRHTHTLKAGAAEGMEQRKRRLYDELKPYCEKYGAQMVRDFFDYWTEPDHALSKMRYELERTWSVRNRLRTWAARESQFHGQRGGLTAAQKEAKARNEQLVARMAKENTERATAQRHDPKAVTREEYLAMKARGEI